MTNLFGSKFSRRSLFSRKISNLFALALVPALVQACGTPEAEQAGTNQTAPKKGPRKGTVDSKSSKKSSADAEEASEVSASTNQQTTAVQQQNQALPSATPATQPPGSTQLAASTPPVNSKVTGAKPDNGFFSRGAPTLSLAQITAGQQVAAKCEGGLHDLVIEPQHLQALAQGQTVTIKSSTQTHFGNPTVHNHSVTYTPTMG